MFVDGQTLVLTDAKENSRFLTMVIFFLDDYCKQSRYISFIDLFIIYDNDKGQLWNTMRVIFYEVN